MVVTGWSLATWRLGFERLLEGLVLLLIGGLAVLVVAAVILRKTGSAIVWYDEVASILLAWLTYYGAALAALKRAHIGFPGLVAKLPPGWRRAVLVVREILVLGFFAILAVAGLRVLDVLWGMRLTSLPEVPVAVAHSVIPIGAILFVVAELLAFLEAWRDPWPQREEIEP